MTSPIGRRVRGLAAVLVAVTLAAVSLAAAGGRELTVGEKVVAAARAHIGNTYAWGATGPDTFDCSGFTQAMWLDAGGVTLPRVSRQQQAWAVPLPAEQVEPGDLVFYGDPVSHVGLAENRVTTVSKGISTTVVQMIDASSSRQGVVRRTVWQSPTLRFGRVPREGMTPVRPWTPPPAPVVPVVPVAPLATPVPAPAPRPSLAPAPAGPLVGLPAIPAGPSSSAALKATRLARAALGNRTLSDVALVQNVFGRAAGLRLPATRAGLLAAAHRVPLDQARVGDLVVYPAPAAHVGVYVGQGLMVDASRSLGAVVLRTVWAAPGVQLHRLPA